jgi:hypothetical protein
MGAAVTSEPSTDKGRVDAVIETPERTFVLEFKLGAAEDALAQIEAKGYAEAWLGKGRPVTLLGCGGFAERPIACTWKDL